MAINSPITAKTSNAIFESMFLRRFIKCGTWFGRTNIGVAQGSSIVCGTISQQAFDSTQADSVNGHGVVSSIIFAATPREIACLTDRQAGRTRNDSVDGWGWFLPSSSPLLLRRPLFVGAGGGAALRSR